MQGTQILYPTGWLAVFFQGLFPNDLDWNYDTGIKLAVHSVLFVLMNLNPYGWKAS